MPRSPTVLPSYYRVDLSPDAWREVGRVPAGDFQVLQGVMRLLAFEGTPFDQGAGPHTLTVAGFEMLYTRDDVARTLTLHRVASVLQEPGEAAWPGASRLAEDHQAS